MKKRILVIIGTVLLGLLTSCGKPAAASDLMEPKAAQMKAICELAVMDCYYHNVAKFKEEDASGILWWQKDKNFWIEYSGVVTLGIDASLLSVEVRDTQVTITIPQATVLRCTVDSSSLTEDSFIVAQDSAKIEAEDEVAAFAAAQSHLEESAASDTALLASAQQRVQGLLEDYITNIGRAVGKEYSVTWNYLKENPVSPEQEQELDSSAAEESAPMEETS